ncbi:RagB/SusD family nutrient uptake outer membrane protein [Sphingobacterium sp. N143]|uniref:RagB/SusD family nutrient uptake outer membrane protein n=1 Tax=Sphingobacterium sp. N143 TaxID=2746727 RepID=UPI002577871D|nr:RagB/SusD family nutrient uptake outer membrane protein [Sphingobacterium sp. N143]MDM1295391.1 RagB/SusD family nutrient uptake outer membrane protein [Sphingobacterium sp. N143]
MKNILTITVLTLSFGLTSCNKWLDVKPEDKFIEEEVFKTPQGFYDALNGIYLNISGDKLYGRTLNLEILDLLAQTYYISAAQSEPRKQLNNFNYGDKDVKAQLDAIWANLYVNITNINRFLENLDTYGQVLDTQTRGLMEGEALTARAYLYLDILRLFAPAFSVNKEAQTIPYYTNTTYEAAPYFKSTDVLVNILADLKKSTDLLLKYDPAIHMEQIDQTIGEIQLGAKPFLQFRNYHFNYFAAKGLEARANLWGGHKEDALKAAEAVIAAKSKFPWIQASDLSNVSQINRVFSMELLLAFESANLYKNYDELFSPALEDRNILSAGTTNKFINTVYENWENDFRYASNWRSNGGKSYPVFLKYADISATNYRNFRYTVPGIRISEMYLIASECEPDQTKALAYLNELRKNRNCDVLSSTTDLADNIKKEYRKEFYGEGQLWYYYKRNDNRTINGATTTNKSVGVESYTFPIPQSETDPR